MNILFSAGGRRVEIIELFKKALPRDRILVADIVAHAPALYIGHEHFLIPRMSEAGSEQALLKLFRRHKAEVVIPLIDPEIDYYNRHRAHFEKAGIKILLSGPEAVARGRDKWQTFLFFREIGIPTPRTWQGRDQVGIFPVVAKPVSGSAGRGVVIARDRETLLNYPGIDRGYIYQEWIDGEEITIDVVGDGAGGMLASCQRLRLKSRAGEAERAVTLADPGIESWVRQITTALKPLGVVNYQLLRDAAGQVFFHEINLRLGGGCPLACHAGVNLPRLLKDVILERRPRRAAPQVTPGVHMLRYDRAFYRTQGEMLNG